MSGTKHLMILQLNSTGISNFSLYRAASQHSTPQQLAPPSRLQDSIRPV